MKKAILFIPFLIIGLVIQTAMAQSVPAQQKPIGELLYSIIQSEGVEVAVDKYEELRKRVENDYDFGESSLNTLGYRLLNEGNYNAATAIFKLNTEYYPQSINVWDSLAEGYFNLGKKELAEKYYLKVLAMLDSDTNLPPAQVNFFRFNAQTQLAIVRNFDPPAVSDFHYVSFYGGPPAGHWDMETIAEFKEREGIKLSYAPNNLYRSPVPGNVEQTLTGRYPPDVSTGFIAGDYRRFIERGFIADISFMWEQEGWAAVFPAPFKRMATYNGKQYFVPMAYQWNPIWYRKDIFEKHNLAPPESWEELLELCNRLNKLGYIPFTISVQNWPPPVARWFTTLNLRLNGPEFHQQAMEGNISFTDERIRTVFVHWRELFRISAFADSSWQNNYQSGMRDLVSGNAVMYNLGEWIFESLDEEQGAKLDFFPFPGMNPKITPAEIVHTYGAFMTTNNADPETSKTLLKWLGSTGVQQDNVEVLNRTVANKKVNRSLYTDIQKRITTHVNDTEVLVPLFEFNTHPEFAQKALNIFQLFWKDSEKIDTALNKLEQARLEVFEPEPQATGCEDHPESRQFDFWVGEWDVYVEGEKVSESVIERTLGGCMILENYTSLRYDYAGKSMNFYDVKLGKWVQIWTDITGNVSRYTGELKDGKMYFRGTNIARDGTESEVRMEFIPNQDGSVRQIYEQSVDGGKTWKTLFDGLYRTNSSQK